MMINKQTKQQTNPRFSCCCCKRGLIIILILIPLSGVGTTCFSQCCDKDLPTYFTTGRLPTSTILGNVANDCKRSQDERFNLLSEAWKN
jgi:hypothetical protein